MGCDRLGSSRWTLCMLEASMELAGWVTRDFLRLGEGHDTEEFAQSCKRRALESVVLEGLGLAGAQQPLSAATEYRVQPVDISMNAIQHTTLYAYRQPPFKDLPGRIYNIQCTGHPINTSCILTSPTFCWGGDIRCHEHLPLNRPSLLSQAQLCPEEKRARSL